MSSHDSLEKQDLTAAIDVVVDGHQRLTKLEKLLEKNITDMDLFYSKTDPRQKETKIPYQYMDEHQEEWLRCWIPISRQLAIVDRIVMEKYERLFSLEVAKSQQQPPQQGTVPGGLASLIVQPYTPQPKEKRSIFPSFGRKPEPPAITPFKMSIQEILEKRKIKQMFYDYVDFHKTMVEYTKPMDFGEDLGIKFNWMNYTGVMNLLSVERSEFIIRAQKVLTLISEGYEIVREKSQKDSVSVLTAAAHLEERHRLPM